MSLSYNFSKRIILLTGLFCILPCTDEYRKVDLRTVSFDVPPQEVCYFFNKKFIVLLQQTTRKFVYFLYKIIQN